MQFFDLPYPDSQQKSAPKRQEKAIQESEVKIGRRYRSDRLRASVIDRTSGIRKRSHSMNAREGGKHSFFFLNLVGILLLAAGLCIGFLAFMKGYWNAFIPCLIACLVLLYLN